MLRRTILVRSAMEGAAAAVAAGAALAPPAVPPAVEAAGAPGGGAAVVTKLDWRSWDAFVQRLPPPPAATNSIRLLPPCMSGSIGDAAANPIAQARDALLKKSSVFEYYDQLRNSIEPLRRATGHMQDWFIAHPLVVCDAGKDVSAKSRGWLKLIMRQTQSRQPTSVEHVLANGCLPRGSGKVVGMAQGSWVGVWQEDESYPVIQQSGYADRFEPAVEVFSHMEFSSAQQVLDGLRASGSYLPAVMIEDAVLTAGSAIDVLATQRAVLNTAAGATFRHARNIHELLHLGVAIDVPGASVTKINTPRIACGLSDDFVLCGGHLVLTLRDVKATARGGPASRGNGGKGGRGGKSSRFRPSRQQDGSKGGADGGNAQQQQQGSIVTDDGRSFQVIDVRLCDPELHTPKFEADWAAENKKEFLKCLLSGRNTWDRLVYLSGPVMNATVTNQQRKYPMTEHDIRAHFQEATNRIASVGRMRGQQWDRQGATTLWSQSIFSALDAAQVPVEQTSEVLLAAAAAATDPSASWLEHQKLQAKTPSLVIRRQIANEGERFAQDAVNAYQQTVIRRALLAVETTQKRCLEAFFAQRNPGGRADAAASGGGGGGFSNPLGFRGSWGPGLRDPFAPSIGGSAASVQTQTLLGDLL